MSKLSTSYRADIDGLRGIAVFCVVVYHCGLAAFNGGFVGVDIFFVISGYLICAIIQREIEEETFSYARFYARRARRILPALFVVVAASIVLAILIMTTAEMKDFAKSAVANIGAFSNIYFWQSANYFSTSAELKPLMMTWSLSVEEQFYLFFPPVLLLARRLKWQTGVALGVLSAASLAASVWVTAHDPSSAFFLLPTRAWELGVGALVAHMERRAVQQGDVLPIRHRELLGAAGLAAVAFSIFSYDSTTPFPGIAAALPVCGTAMLIAARGSFVNRNIVGNKVLVLIGLVSYSWYLWHWPLLSFARLVADRQIDLATSLSLAALSFVIAILSWRYVEQPFRTRRQSDRKTLRDYGAATAAMLAIAGVLVLGHGWQRRLPDQFLAVERSARIDVDPCLAGYGKSAPSLDGICKAGGAANTIALIGDSHAAALAPALRALAHRQGLAFTQFTKSSCPALAGVTRRMLNHPLHDRECMAFNDDALKRLRDDANVKVVFLAGYWSAPFAEETSGQRFVSTDALDAPVSPEQSRLYLKRGLAATVEYLGTAGKTVVLLNDTPIFNFDPVRSVAADKIPFRKRLAAALNVLPAGDGHSVSDSQLTNKGDLAYQYVQDIGKDFPFVTVLDPAASLCFANRCSYSGTGALYYVDSQHLSEAGANIVLNQRSVNRMLSNSTALMGHSAGLPSL